MNKGGRPRNKTLEEIKGQQSSLEVQNKKDGGSIPNGLRKLKEMYRLRNKLTMGEAVALAG